MQLEPFWNVRKGWPQPRIDGLKLNSSRAIATQIHEQLKAKKTRSYLQRPHGDFFMWVLCGIK